MGIGQTLLLGFIAGVTILFGMPLGRMRRPTEALRVTLNAVAVGVLVFLVWDWPRTTSPARASAPRSGTACCSPSA